VLKIQIQIHPEHFKFLLYRHLSEGNGKSSSIFANMMIISKKVTIKMYTNIVIVIVIKLLLNI